MYIYKVMTTPKYNKRASKKYIKKRLAEDPEFRKKTNEWNRKSYEKNKEITKLKEENKTGSVVRATPNHDGFSIDVIVEVEEIKEWKKNLLS